ncbi:hypothetical protein [Bosea sp. RAC05]|uniref:hypothetical protein n=1 Tax=Bosea sp. RAC05 TaxID=1842539 RepID=UPI00083CB467|nr:hypothetical protein [Bosea sp. RAC05]AOG02970.1 hypothetical protein BSY19_4886 [Bosea sp. RAC05]
MASMPHPDAGLVVDSYVLLVDQSGRTAIRLERRGRYDEDRWAIVEGSACLSTDGMVFVTERMPSNRTEEFFSTTRFTLKQALELWLGYLAILPTEQPWLKSYRYAYGSVMEPAETL